MKNKNSIIKIIIVLLIGFGFCKGVEPKVNSFVVTPDRLDIVAGEYLKLTVDIDIAPGCFIYSTDSE